VRDAYHGRYLPSGHLVFMREEAIYAVAFDLDRLEVVGEPARAVESVQSILTTGGAQFACSDRGTLVYVPSPAATSSIQWFDHSGVRKPLRGVPGIYSAPSFSPDGRRLAMEIVEGRERDLWIYEWESDRLTRLTFDPASDSRPVWTPDGKRIVFDSTRGRNGIRNLYWQRADGTGEAEQLTSSENAQWPGSWHPDGKHLAFSEMSPATVRPDIMTLEMEGSEEQGWKAGKPRPFFESPYVENLPEFSPDGRWLAYMSNQTGRFEVYVRPFPGPGGIWQVSTQSGRYPVWSRVRRELFFWSSDERIMVAPYTVDGKEFRAEKPRPWSEARFPVPPRTFKIALHPDGERFAMVSPLRASDTKRDKVVLILNFFAYLRQIAPVGIRGR
jgi:serine/threonine-protein kinase